MAEEVSLVMSLHDKVSSTLKAIAGNSKAFDKTLDELEAGLVAYGKAQDALAAKYSTLKKSLAESNVKVQETTKSYKKLKDETSKGAMEAAIEEQVELRRQLTETEQSIKAQNDAYKTLYKNATDAAAAASKLDNRAGSSGQGSSIVSGDSLFKSLASAGIYKMLGDSVSQFASVAVESAIGQPAATMVSSTVSGLTSGAAMGSIAGPIGAAIGAGVGALAGAITGGSQIYSSKDDAFKSYVQEAYETQLSERDTAISSGSTIAGGREQKQLAFSTLLGSDEAAKSFLADVQAMAAQTNYTYDEITGYAKSMVKPFGTDKTMDILTTLSDTSAALSLNESDNSVLIAGLSRMKLTDKTTQEYLNYFSERGIDVYAALSKWGDAAAVAEKVTAGKIKGSEAVEEILAYMQEQYGGLSEKMASTFEGMIGNLEDAQANAEAAYGEGYNEARKEGIQAQTDWLNSGAMDEANQAIGAWQAELENEKERFIRESVDAMMASDEYRTAKAEGDAAEMGRLIMQAKVQGMNEYNATEGAQAALEAERALAEAIRNDTATNDDYWDAGYEKGNWFTKGLAAARRENNGITGIDPVGAKTANSNSSGSASNTNKYSGFGIDPAGAKSASSGSSHAYGLDRVPYDNFPAVLHAGERVLTASQAREQDNRQSGYMIHIPVEQLVVRQDSDVDAVAEALVQKIQLAQLGGVR